MTRPKTPSPGAFPVRRAAPTGPLARAALLALAPALLAAGCTSDKGGTDPAKTRLWGRDPASEATLARAKETIDAYGLETNEAQRERVLTMDFEEVVARLGFCEYKGVARFELEPGGSRTLTVHEDTTIQHGLHGSFRVLQQDESGDVTRETIYDNGVFYVRNGGGDLRVQGIIKDQHLVVRDEAWQPLRVYTRYFGPRLVLEKIGADTVAGRSAAHYKLKLGPGPELVTAKGIEGAKRPVSLGGDVWVDDQTAVPTKAALKGVLEIPNAKAGSTGKLTVALDFTLKSVEGAEIKPKSYVPTIKRHPVDLAPLDFLDGGVRTSTVIGGKKPKTLAPPPELEASPATLGSTTAKKKDEVAPKSEPEKPKKKKQKKAAHE